MQGAEGAPVRNLVLWLLIIAGIAFIGHQSGQFGTRRQPGEPVSGNARIIDGDSLEIAGARIRIFGIDAPEGRQQCRNAQGADYACGRDAARALDRIIGGRTVTCTPVSHDQYERDIATCEVIGRDIGEAMVRAGHARDYTRHSRGRYASAEREAREAKRGMWAGSFEDPAAYRKREMK
jgi:endonuclease YncB( thermonuclease family)